MTPEQSARWATDRIAQLEGIQRNQESALAHWRSEADRDAGKIARLEKRIAELEDSREY
jgi:polyhydroxyalkanoate synthesis regulator phasin